MGRRAMMDVVEQARSASLHQSWSHVVFFLLVVRSTAMTTPIMARLLQRAYHRTVLCSSLAVTPCCSLAHPFICSFTSHAGTLPPLSVCVIGAAIAVDSAAYSILASTIRAHKSR